MKFGLKDSPKDVIKKCCHKKSAVKEVPCIGSLD